MITCILIPHFVAETTRQVCHLPEAAPLIVSTPSGRKVIASCAESARLGIRPQLSVRQTRLLCPTVQVIPENPAREQHAIEQVLDALSEFTPFVEYAVESPARRRADQIRSLDERQAVVFYVDLETIRPADAVQMARQMGAKLRECFQLVACIGLAAGKFTAYAAAANARAGSVLPVTAGAEAAFLEPLPITLLPMTEEVRRRLTLLGLTTLGTFADLSASAILTQFGRHGLFIHHLTQGRDFRPVIAYQPRLIEHISRDFESPVPNRLILEAIVHSLATELAARLQAKSCMGRTLILQLTLDDHTVRESRITARKPSATTASLVQLLTQLLARINTGRHGVIGLAITLTDIVPFAGQQLDLFTHQTGQRDHLEKALGALAQRHGADRFYWITSAERESPLIERRYRFQSIESLSA